MRILIVSEFFDPEPTLKGLGFAKALVADGHEVEVLTGFPNYPGGKVYPGYKQRLHQREVIDGVVVHRVPLFPSHDRSAKRRLLTYLSFAFSASVVGPFVVRRPDVLYVYHPPLSTTLPALVLKTFLRCPAVMDIQDLWPDTLTATGMVSPGRVTNFIGRCANFVYRQMDRIVVLSPGFRSRLMERGVPAGKIRTIYNWNDESRQSSATPDREFAATHGFLGHFNVLFAGALGPAQALDSVLDAAKICRESAPQVRVHLMGQGFEAERLHARVRSEGIKNVSLIPARPMSAMGSILPLADALLVSLRADPLFAITIPSKTQAYLATGVPILIAANGDAAELMRKAGGGVVVPPEDPEALAHAMGRLARLSSEERSQMGANGRAFYERNLSMGVGVCKFEEVFAEASVARKRGQSAGSPVRSGGRHFYRRYGKRLFDLALVIPALLVLTPLFLLLAICTWATMGLPLVFQQRRAGKDGRVFDIYKFRSMSTKLDADGRLLPDHERTPSFGAFLRRSSLDELPSLFNVLKGDMSLVGPRPLLPEYLPRYSARHARRHDVRPGITGEAQINGRQLALFSQRMELDVWYVEHVSFASDLRILVETLPKVLRSRGVMVGQDVRDVDDLGLSPTQSSPCQPLPNSPNLSPITARDAA